MNYERIYDDTETCETEEEIEETYPIPENTAIKNHVAVKKESLQFLGIQDGIPMYRKITVSDTLTSGTLKNTGSSVLYRAVDTEEGKETVIVYNHDRKTVTRTETMVIEQISSLENAMACMLDYIPRK